MSNSIFPSLPGLTWNITRTPNFATKIQQAVGGREIAAAFQPYPIWRYVLEYEFLRTYTPSGASAYTEWQQLAGFFTARQGSYDTFLYTDPEDASVTAESFGTGDGSTTAFQLIRKLGTSGLAEPIYNLNGSASIYKNAVLQGSGYTISSGLVTFSVAPANGVALTWTGSYYWRCRFEQDTLQFGMFASHFWNARQVAFRTVLGA